MFLTILVSKSLLNLSQTNLLKIEKENKGKATMVVFLFVLNNDFKEKTELHMAYSILQRCRINNIHFFLKMNM